MAAPTGSKTESISGLLLVIELQLKAHKPFICEKDKNLDTTVLHQAETCIYFHGGKNLKRKNKWLFRVISNSYIFFLILKL
jgi:hypothetical protein